MYTVGRNLYSVFRRTDFGRWQAVCPGLPRMQYGVTVVANTS